MEIADPTGPGGATFNTELSAEWGRVLLGFLYDDPIFAAGTDITGLSFTWIASSDPTADADLPQLGSGITGIYTDIVGGSFPVHVYDADGMSGDGTVTPVIETGTHQITAEVNFDTGKLELFEINGTFPTATLRLINDDGMTDFSSGFVFFDPFSDPRNSVTTAQAMCVTGCGIFGGAVFGAAGAGGIGITGAYHANTSNPYPPHTFNSSFAVQRTYLGPPLP